jgi:hypothetical protein
MPEASRIRRRTVEHVFGTLKAWMGFTHFLTKTLPRVSPEMSLQASAYKLKRMIRIFGAALGQGHGGIVGWLAQPISPLSNPTNNLNPF